MPRAHAERGTQIDPKNSLYHLWLARSYGEQADREHSFSLARKVKKEFEEAVQLDPSNTPARRDLEEFNIQAPWIVGGNKDAAGEQVRCHCRARSGAGASCAREIRYRARSRKMTWPRASTSWCWRRKWIASNPTLKLRDSMPTSGAERKWSPRFRPPKRSSPEIRASDTTGRSNVFLPATQASTAEPLLKSYLANTPDRSDWPSHASAREWLGRLYEQQGKRQQAAEQYRAALELDPGDKDARARLQKLEKAAE